MQTPRVHLLHQAETNNHLAYETWGQGETLLCLPAFGDSREEYRHLAPLLAASGYQVIVMDLRGMGESAAAWPHYSLDDMSRDVALVLQDAGAGTATLVGCSTAAMVAVHTALTYPERIQQLVLISPLLLYTGVMHPYWQWMARVPKLLHTTLGRALWTWQLRRLYPTHPSGLDAYLKHIRHELSRKGRGTDFVAVHHQFHFAPVEQRLGELSLPSLIVVGEQDIVLRQARHEARRLQASIPHSTSAVIPYAGHYPHWECPTPTASAMLAWLQQIGEARSAHVRASPKA